MAGIVLSGPRSVVRRRSACGRLFVQTGTFDAVGDQNPVPHAQDAPGCKGLSPWVEVGGVGAVVEGAGLLTICTMSGATLISVR
ncbi:hypothetical protein BKH20_00890 [Actinomyces oris]|uniref:Uncharacterized protein n=1 Tax=Actinomyces oris TaxID=544580 RepID=A0A1Q8WY19_9ACTO|nr:hypothetical protein BKH20_00890 [Actinomyces oris]